MPYPFGDFVQYYKEILLEISGTQNETIRDGDICCDGAAADVDARARPKPRRVQ